MIPHKSSDFEAIDLVDAWEEVLLEDLIEDAIGGAWGDDPSKATEDQVIVRVIRGTEFRHWEKEKGATAATRAIDSKSFARRMLVPGDMVVEISGGGPSQPVGRTLVVDQEALDELGGKAISSNFCRRVRFKSHINPFYVDQALKLKYSLGELDQFQTETTNIRNLTFPKFISETSIPLPQREVQDQLVIMIKGLQAQIGQARDRLATIPALLKKFRQSVLAAACSGQLTADWRDSQIETDIDDIGSIPETWKVQPFHSIIQELRNGVSPRPSMAPPGVPLLRISSTRAMSVDLDEVRYLPQGERFLPQFGLLDGDLLFTRYNGSLELLGVCGMVRGLNGRSLLYPDKLMRVRLKPEVADPRFIEIFFSGPGARERMTLSSRSTAGQQGVSGKDVKEQLVVLPPMSEQVEIVRRVESLFALADSIESRLAEATAQVERTTQAILAKAFRGEL